MDLKEIVKQLEQIKNEKKFTKDQKVAIKAAIKKLKNAHTRKQVRDIIEFLAKLFSNFF